MCYVESGHYWKGYGKLLKGFLLGRGDHFKKMER